MSNTEAFEYWRLDDGELELVAEQVGAQAPEVFAICEIERAEDGGEPTVVSIVAWGFALADHTEAISCDGGMHCRCESVEDTMALFAIGAEVGLALPGPSRVALQV